MSDLLRRARKVRSVIDDDSLPKPQRVTQALGAFGGLKLTGMSLDVRTNLETHLVGVNRILANYDLETVKAYRQMKDTDLQQILDILDALVS